MNRSHLQAFRMPHRTMAPPSTAVTTQSESTLRKYELDPEQTLRAATALLRKIQTDSTVQKASTDKASLLADAEKDDAEDEVPVWLVLTTKKHIIDKKRLKPGKIALPHPYLDAQREGLRICLITADPQRKYKELITHPNFPLELGSKITRVLGLEKLKSKYKSYESRRQLLSEYDVFLADDRVITYLPTVLGKVFYKSGSKRPIPVSLEGKRQNFDEVGNKRQKLAAGGKKVTKTDPVPSTVAAEISKTLSSALVHLAPSTTTAIKVGIASQSPAQIQANVEAVVDGMIDKFVPQKWKNVRAVHIKGPETAALPIWLADELWTDEADVLEEAPVSQAGKKRKRGALAEAGQAKAEEVLEVPGPDGKMRKLTRPAAPEKKRKTLDATAETEAKPAKKRKSEPAEAVAAKTAEKAEKEERKEALRAQKEKARVDLKAPTVPAGSVKQTRTRPKRAVAADLI